MYIFLNRVPFGAGQISYGRESLVKLGCCRPNFKITLEERPSEKSCSTSFFQSVNDKVKKAFIPFFHVNVSLVAIPFCNILGLTNKSLMGFKFGIKFSKG